MKTKEEIAIWLLEKIAKETKLEPAFVTANTPFDRFGLDSIVIVTLVDDLEQWLNVSLDPTIFWEYPSIEELSKWLVEEKLG